MSKFITLSLWALISVVTLAPHTTFCAAAASVYDLNVAFFEAVYLGNLQRVEKLLAAKVDINAQDRNGANALDYAFIRKGNERVALALIAAGINIHRKDIQDFTPLHRASEKGDTNTVKALLAAKADVDSVDLFNITSLHKAATYGYLDILRELLDAAAKTDIRSNLGQTALHKAVHVCSSECVQLLLENGADTEIRDCFRETPLMSVLEKIINNYDIHGNYYEDPKKALEKYEHIISLIQAEEAKRKAEGSVLKRNIDLAKLIREECELEEIGLARRDIVPLMQSPRDVRLASLERAAQEKAKLKLAKE